MPHDKPSANARCRDWSRFIVQHTPGAVITTDAGGRITEFNPAAEKLTGYSRQEALGQPAKKILHCEGGESENALDQVLSGKLEVTQELTLRNRGGEPVPVMLSSIALQNEQKALLGAAIIIRDLNQIKHLEMERRHMVNMFAHDLKTPVVGMAGLIRRLLQGKAGPLFPEQRNYLEIIDREMTRLEKLITSFLEFARLDLRILTPQPEDIEVQEECREVAILLAPLAEAKDIELQTVLPPELPRLRVDPLLFRRVLENLMGNAIKFSPPQAVVLLQAWNDEKEVRFAVKDQGPGIPPEEMPHLFEFFHRGQSAGETEGFGLGLATVKRIIDSHGGRLWVDTAPGQGASFYFSLPK
jgi:two-component system phosphate regulon sensor histidine kinase PhoR